MAMAMGHVILKEFYVEREVPYFRDYARRFTDLPLLVTLRERDGGFVPDRLLRASDLGAATRSTPSGSRWCSTSAPASPSVPERLGRAPLRRAGPLEPAAGRDRAGC